VATGGREQREKGSHTFNYQSSSNSIQEGYISSQQKVLMQSNLTKTSIQQSSESKKI
jgi:hypothetical protein